MKPIKLVHRLQMVILAMLMTHCAMETDSPDTESPEVDVATEMLGSRTNRGSSEKFVACPADSVMTGFGGIVSDDNFTSVTVWCNAVDAAGNLSSSPVPSSNGAFAHEAFLFADAGKVIVGLGAIVSNDNLAKIVIKQCSWWQGHGELVNVPDQYPPCTYKRSSFTSDNSTEAFLDGHAGLTIFEAEHAVLAGAGMGARNGNLKDIQVHIQHL